MSEALALFGDFELVSPLWLLLLLLLPLVIARPWLAGGRAALRWSGLGHLDAGANWRVHLAIVPDIFGALGLILLIVALARPAITHRDVMVESEGLDIMLVLDTSGSMDTDDMEFEGKAVSRIAVAKAVLDSFIGGRPLDRIGLVVFGEEAFTQVPLTRDGDGIRRFLSQVESGMAGESNTAIGMGLAVGSNRLAKLDAPSRILILLTDGRNNAGRISPMQAAEAAKALGIRIYTVGVGSHSGTVSGPFGMRRRVGRDEIDERTLTAVAETTGGRYFRATDPESLLRIYDTIDKMEKTTARVKERVRRDELYRYALVPGLGLLVLQQLLMSTLFRRLP